VSELANEQSVKVVLVHLAGKYAGRVIEALWQQ
jgi:hypothetical protein